MEYGLYNIASATTTTLIDTHSDKGSINSISICNTHDSSAATISLFLDDGTNQSYIINEARLFAKTTMLIDHNLSFDNSVLALKLTNTGGTPLSVIIK